MKIDNDLLDDFELGFFVQRNRSKSLEAANPNIVSIF